MRLAYYVNLSLISAAIITLVGCESIIEPPTGIQQELSDAHAQLEKQSKQPPAPPQAVMQDLMLPTAAASAALPVQDELRFSIAADQVEARDFFASLVEGTPYSVAIHPEVSGTVTLNLQQVTLEEALNVVQALYGYDVRRIGNVLQIFPSKLRSKTFSIDYLMLTRMGRSRTTINSSSLVDGDKNSSNSSSSSSSYSSSSSSSSEYGNDGSNSNNTGTLIRTQSESDFWKELKDAVTLMVGNEEGTAVITSPQSGLLTVKAMPADLAEVETFVNRLQNRVQRQVLLEAKILEVRLSDGYQQGINWEALTSGTAGFTGSFSNVSLGNDISTLVGGVLSLGYESTNFTAMIDLLKTQGNVNVLSSPRISAANNQKAVIKVGTDEYFVTEVSATTVTGTSTSTTPEVQLTPFFNGIALDVTPQIDDMGGVLLHVHPSVTDIAEQTKVISIFDEELSLPMAQSDIRETDTIVRARSGEVVVIGGLMSTVRNQINSKVPILGDIPLLGGLFTNISDQEDKTELVIMIKPTIIESGQGAEQLNRTNQNLDSWYRDAQKRFD